jgi:hypothetical protein
MGLGHDDLLWTVPGPLPDVRWFGRKKITTMVSGKKSMLSGLSPSRGPVAPDAHSAILPQNNANLSHDRPLLDVGQI